VITTALDTLSSRFGERWANVISPLGLLFVAALWAGLLLGQSNALDGAMLVERSADEVHSWGSGSTVTVGVIVISLAVATAASFLAGQVGSLVERSWSAKGPAWWVKLGRDGQLGRWQVAKGRRARWLEADQAYRTAIAEATDASADLPLQGELAARRNQIALAEPQRPTWIGDRLRVVGERVHHQYGLDPNAAWPRLWLVLPEATREELRTARAELAGAARLVGWALVFAVLAAALWWPAAVVAAILAPIGWNEARTRAETFASLVEASFDVYSVALAAAVQPADGAVTPAIGREISERLRKGA
jgi:hypothetical protein